MNVIINTQSGQVHFGNVVLSKGLLPVDLTENGLNFVREFDLKTGCIYRSIGIHEINGQHAFFTLEFYDNKLRRLSFTFDVKNNIDDDLEALFKMHNDFLFKELGSPYELKQHQVIYPFPWGEVVSELDWRGGSCSILWCWN